MLLCVAALSILVILPAALVQVRAVLPVVGDATVPLPAELLPGGRVLLQVFRAVRGHRGRRLHKVWQGQVLGGYWCLYVHQLPERQVPGY